MTMIREAGATDPQTAMYLDITREEDGTLLVVLQWGDFDGADTMAGDFDAAEVMAAIATLGGFMRYDVVELLPSGRQVVRESFVTHEAAGQRAYDLNTDPDEENHHFVRATPTATP